MLADQELLLLDIDMDNFKEENYKNLPFNLLWGVDVAIKKLRPGASFGLSNNTVSEWNDPENREPPSWDEIAEQMEKDKSSADDWLKTNNL